MRIDDDKSNTEFLGNDIYKTGLFLIFYDDSDKNNS